VLHADSPDLHPGQRRLPVEADADVASRCVTTAASGCRSRRRIAARIPNQIRRGRSRLLPRADVSVVRQPLPA
jgi:hypothetical protein